MNQYEVSVIGNNHRFVSYQPYNNLFQAVGNSLKTYHEETGESLLKVKVKVKIKLKIGEIE